MDGHRILKQYLLEKVAILQGCANPLHIDNFNREIGIYRDAEIIYGLIPGKSRELFNLLQYCLAGYSEKLASVLWGAGLSCGSRGLFVRDQSYGASCQWKMD